MKQSKPYGRNFNARDRSRPTQAAADISPSKPAWTEAPTGVVRERSPVVPALRENPRPGFAARVIRWSLLLVALQGFIVTRDSVFVHNLIILTSNMKATLICVSGEMQYEGWSPWDRLVGNGQFLCTDWKVHKRSNRYPFL